jgi:hypothetical protein
MVLFCLPVWNLNRSGRLTHQRVLHTSAHTKKLIWLICSAGSAPLRSRVDSWARVQHMPIHTSPGRLGESDGFSTGR